MKKKRIRMEKIRIRIVKMAKEREQEYAKKKLEWKISIRIVKTENKWE